MGKEIWVLCEVRGGRLTAASAELLGAAERLGGTSCAVIFGCAESQSLGGCTRVYRLHGASPEADSRGRLLAMAIAAYRPEIILAPSTNACRTICAVAAAKVRTGLTADCTDLALDESGMLVQTRPALGGGLIARIVCPDARPQMATVRPGSFPVPGEAARHAPVYTDFTSELDFRGVRGLGCTADGAERKRLAESRVIVAGGMGIGSAEGFRVLEDLAEALGGGVAATRAAVNAGYAPYAWQVGQSGVTVRPELYIALGISGAVQHLAGIRFARRIIAVNTDPEAPIFRCADIGVAADWRVYTQELLRQF